MKQSVDTPASSNVFEAVAGQILALAVGLDAKFNVRREDYFILSIFTYKSPLTDHKPLRVLGMAHQYRTVGE